MKSLILLPAILLTPVKGGREGGKEAGRERGKEGAREMKHGKEGERAR